MAFESLDPKERSEAYQRLKKSVKAFLMALISLMLGYLAVSLSVGLFSRKALDVLKLEMSGFGMQPGRLSLSRARLRGLNCLEWDDFSAGIFFQKNAGAFSSRYFEFHVPSLSICLFNFKKRLFHITFPAADILFLKRGENRMGEQFIVTDAAADLRLDFMNFREFKREMHFLAAEMADLFVSGATEIPMKFSGVSYFELAQRKITARFGTEFSGTMTRIVMKREDLENISAVMAEKLREEEIKVIAHNPLLAPKLLQIRDKASREAAQKAQEIKGFPEDAYRHVYWSFLLTKEWGPKFAEEVTDAHESGFDNPEAEKRMDLNNNQAGRRYALGKYSEQELEQKVLQDAEVIRSPHAAASKLAGLPASLEPEKPLPVHSNTLEVVENLPLQEGEGRVNAKL